MSQVLYGRVAQLMLGIPGDRGVVLDSFTRDSRTGVLRDGLKFRFKIEKTSDKFPNKARIEVYNLSPSTQALLEGKKGITVDLKAGYGNIIPNAAGDPPVLIGTIFRGDALKSYTKKEGADIITVLESGDGQNAYDTARIDQSYGDGVRSASIVDSLVGLMGVARGDTSGLDEDDAYVNGYVASGMARDVLDELTERNNAEWSIQDGALQIVKSGRPTQKEAILLASAFGSDRQNTGIVGSPTRSGFQGSGEKKLDGVEAVALLQPDLNPGQRVVIQTKKVNGTYVIRKSTFEGDTTTGPWYAKLEVVPL